MGMQALSPWFQTVRLISGIRKVRTTQKSSAVSDSRDGDVSITTTTGSKALPTSKSDGANG
jgi:hypothetical protein